MGRHGQVTQCSECHEERPHEARGLCSRCYARWSYRQGDNAAKAKASADRWKAENPEQYRAGRRAIFKRLYHSLSPDAKLARSRSRPPRDQRAYQHEYFQRNKARAYVQSKNWKHRHPEQRRLEEHRRRAKMVEKVSMPQWKAILSAYQHRCAYCGCGGRMTMDHVLPIAAGGAHSIENLVPACPRCNATKNAKILAVVPALRLML